MGIFIKMRMIQEVVGVGLGIRGLLIGIYGILLERHILRALLMLELNLLLTLILLGVIAPGRWQYLILVILALGVGEAALGLRVVVKISRSGKHDQVRLNSLVK